MEPFDEFCIEPYKPADQEEVKALILAGLKEHWGVIDPVYNSDLNDIRSTYAGAIFLVARQNHRIVGTGVLIPRQDGVAEVVRLSVASELRRQGIGKRILQELIDRARFIGFKQIILETTETWSGAVDFYLRFGFHITHHQDGDVYFALDI